MNDPLIVLTLNDILAWAVMWIVAIVGVVLAVKLVDVWGNRAKW